MSALHIVLLYLTSIPIFLALDFLWLGVIARDMYQGKLGHLLGPVEWVPAIIFYLIFTAGLFFFVIYPGILRGSLTHVLLTGALFGFITYATYDLTNQATLRDWPLTVTIVDMIWGSVLALLVSGSTYLIYGALFK